MRIPFIQPLIIHHPDQLSISWAQRVANQYTKGIKVKQIECISVDVGTTTRIKLRVDHNGPDTLARIWFIKLPSLSWRARSITALPRLLHTEIRFYNELAKTTLVNKPDALYAKSLAGMGSTLVLNDLTEQDCLPGKPDDALSKPQALLVIELLASMHAQFWNKADNNPNFQWLAGSVRNLEDHLGSVLAVPLMKRGLAKAGIIVPKALHRSSLRYASHRRKVMNHLSSGPQTIIHHDCHPGNLFWNQNTPGLLDWQMIRIGEGIGDLAYFLATCLEPSIRRTYETQFIEHYLQSLAKAGIQDIDYEHAQSRYRAHLIYPYEAMLITLAVGGMMNFEANLKLIGRATAAVEENSVFSVLPL